MRRRHAMRSHHRGRQSANQSSRRLRDEGVAKQNPRLRELIPYKWHEVSSWTAGGGEGSRRIAEILR